MMLRLKLDAELASRWADGHVSAATLWEDFAKYVYLPRLRDQEVVLTTIQSGPASTTWQTDGFAVAAGFDQATGRYLALVAGSHPGTLAPTTLVVRPDLASRQRDTEAEQSTDDPGRGESSTSDGPGSGDPGGTGDGGSGDAQPAPVTTFRGTVRLDGVRPVKHFGDIHKEVLDHFAAQVGTDVEVTIEIVAKKTEGFTNSTIRVVSENARTLRFDEGTGFSED